jgi:hypothetical protein
VSSEALERPETPPVRADPTGFWIPSAPGAVIDVYFDDQRIFSVAPDSLIPEGTGAHVPWPEQLRQFLVGHTELRVVEHLSGEVLLRGSLRMGDGEDRITVADRQGRRLAIDKFGVATAMLAGLHPDDASILAREVACLTRDVDDYGVPAFLAYGSLLGAVRNGHLIGHDTDADIAYLSNHVHPADLAMESASLERHLRARGWITRRERAGKIQALVQDGDGAPRHIDIFVAILSDGHLFLDQFVEAPMDRSALVPQSTVVLEGVEILSPANPHELLRATYGPQYLTPDPSFTYRNPTARTRTSRALIGNYRYRRPDWTRHLRPQVEGRSARRSTRFAHWVAEEEERRVTERLTWIDVGCGAATDAIWAARRGHSSVGLDFAVPVLRVQAGIARRAGLDATFWELSFHDLRSTAVAAAALATRQGPRVVTCRNVLDVLDAEGRSNVWMLAGAVLRGHGRMYVQFRTKGNRRDRSEPTFRPVSAERMEAEARERGAAVVERVDLGRTTRLVLTWA